MNLSINTGVPFLTVFLQGLLSFFSPCILPLVPLYISYLAGGTKTVDENGNVRYPRKKVMINTVFFILGIGFAFILLGLGFTAIGHFFSGYRVWFVRAGGMIMILFGLYQLGVLGKAKAIEREHRLPFNMGKWAMSPIMALLLGFTFSFAWTPCVGPVLASVLLMASSSSSAVSGFLLIGVYLIGFVLPFLAVGLFTSTVLGFFKKHQGVIKYTVKVGGILLIFMGIMTITGWMNGLTGYLSSFGGGSSSVSEEKDTVKKDAGQDEKKEEKNTSNKEDSKEEKSDAKTVAAPDFTLTDQSGKTHTLSEYKGKTVFLNFWATWCGPCRQEMPHIQKIYEEYNKNEDDLVVLGVANPRTDSHPKNSDVSEEEIKQFLEDNGYDYPVAMDTTGDVFSTYGISSFPTTFMIDKDGNVFGYVSGSLTEEMIRNIIEQTMEGKTSS
ncbi:redoxin family protein [Bariatricus massiliensis]|uniref:Redoxin family protein n=1 Tax=Bariatricus massiliensis TaxID=1745713 RepID=A0ABS8DJ17_9FIRM|nr:cytochrome c biogenesis protein/redoxin [Bariatricus massiliensis]MCB7305274.1 redoxin family protein [Bariatricus massiliensis]MCB7375833.1 redoxin family protein [Bariatricus massiliensis]MCB7388417.1 redoxin family protein [Bariatricus massiliensis]MCB7412595.1 redoxin family protein [Bariatricus massiliensis]MCQ5254767.1 redoxin family protein [Bariatricus massiliensis]